ncbi:transcriptional regulator with XRE-family HTH domain [Microbacterium halimionae]|uniref:Transcriptional regulator with XRE-family HTH domain n=1 Tax=Microbacterium halimionae TaxID=1526413 RepID=A0A7W3JQ95_9MICO|nr:helix-turn-helix transcriptional regulator [Microbacterium halimionae]MBA8817015.1 transcriptional regulator with XRE-family HTH domain [Microbacterium halimionae]NII94446.1 transcriptional regulator with XRE-family HTH domain [Microbacterium halimionae]
MDRAALAAFLLSRRSGLRPADVGLSAGPRRRTPGLRREEVAQLAGMSADYYTRLEQSRGPQPSTQMLSSLVRALRLTADEGDYLFRVAGHSPPDRSFAGEHVAPGLLRVLDRLEDTPAMILSLLGETLVQNGPAKALFGDASALTGWARSDAYRWFVSPYDARSRYPESDHERQARALVASLRAAIGVMGNDSRAGALVREISRQSPEFVALWAEHEVRRRFEDHKVLIHPEIGEIEVDCQALFTEDQSQVLLVLTAPPRSEAASKLELLAILGTQRFASER